MIAAGCGVSVTQTYAGPRRPATEVATLTTEDTKIDMFDSRRSVFTTRGGKVLEILPGPHGLAVSVFTFQGAPDMPEVRRSEAYLFCFDAEANHVYVARPVPDGTLTRPEIFDETSNAVVSVPCAPAMSVSR